MKRSRTLLVLVGGAVFALGALILLSPGLASAVPVGGLVEALGGPWVFVASFGVLGLVVVITVLLARGIQGIDESTPPDPERVYRVPSPGQSFDEFVGTGVSIRERLFGDRHEQIRQRVRQTALSTLMRTEGMSRQEAKTAIRKGTWTDDSVAASFLSRRQTPGTGERIAAALGSESSFQRGARRAAQAIARHEGESR